MGGFTSKSRVSSSPCGQNCDACDSNRRFDENYRLSMRPISAWENSGASSSSAFTVASSARKIVILPSCNVVCEKNRASEQGMIECANTFSRVT